MKSRGLIFTIALLTASSVFGQETELRGGIKPIVRQMVEYNRIDNQAIGSSGTRTKQYNRFIKLTKIATTEELVQLTDHKSPVVRGYSFWSLAKRNYPDLEIIYNAHLNDTEYVDVMDGCMGGEIQLHAFMRQVVTPNVLDLNCKKLDNR